MIGWQFALETVVLFSSHHSQYGSMLYFVTVLNVAYTVADLCFNTKDSGDSRWIQGSLKYEIINIITQNRINCRIKF